MGEDGCHAPYLAEVCFRWVRMQQQTGESEARGKWRCYLEERQLSQEKGRIRHGDVGQAKVWSWDLQTRGYPIMAGKVKVDVLNMKLGLVTGMVEMEGAGYEKGTGERGKEKRRGPEWGAIGVECEAVARVEERCDRYGRDLLNPNGAFSGRAHQDQPSLHMPDQADPLRPCARELMTERLGYNDGCSQDQTAEASRARGAAGGKAASAVARTEKVQFTSTSADGWPERLAEEPSLRHGLRGDDGRGFGGRRRAEARSPEWDARRELRQAARGQASRERDLLTMEPETTIRSRKRPVVSESREVHASTFGAGRREVALDAKTGRAIEEPGQGVAADTRRARASRGHQMKTCSETEEAVSSTMLSQPSAQRSKETVDGGRQRSAYCRYLDHACEAPRAAWHGKTTKALTEHDSSLWSPQLAWRGFASHEIPDPGGWGYSDYQRAVRLPVCSR